MLLFYPSFCHKLRQSCNKHDLYFVLNAGIDKIVTVAPTLSFFVVEQAIFVTLVSRYFTESLYVTYHSKRDLTGISKSIDPGQPVQSDYGRNFSLLADFLCIK